MIQAKVVADSICGVTKTRLTSVEVRFHRFELAALNTHRMFSRNSASNRAIPLAKTLSRVVHDLAAPIHWGMNQRGMTANGEVAGWRRAAAEIVWKSSSLAAVAHAWTLGKLGLHKQIANRPLEPYQWHVALISATDWENFFAQRIHPDAQPEMAALAGAIRAARASSEPVVRWPINHGNYPINCRLDLVDKIWSTWHLPYVSRSVIGSIVDRCAGDDFQRRWSAEWIEQVTKMVCAVSVGRCARTSTMTHDGRHDLQDDLRVYEKLAKADPPHRSPFEHVATPDLDVCRGNFRNWSQLRHLLFVDPLEV